MKNIYFKILLIIILGINSDDSFTQIIYNWNAYPSGSLSGTIPSGPTGNNMSVSITTVGTSGWAASSPIYTTVQGTGLLLNANWSNLTSSITVVMSFSNALCGPVTFKIFDINQNAPCAFPSNIFKDSVIISGTNNIGTTIFPSSITSSCASNTIISNQRIGGATTCGGSTTTVTFSSANVKTIKIDYLSGRSLVYVPSGPCTNTVSTNSANPRDQLITIGSISGCGVLPIVLLDYNVKCQNNLPLITWTTASEQNNQYFTILRSADGVNYSSIANINSQGNSSSNQNYNYIDQTPLNGLSYYKLKQTNIDNTEKEFSAKSYFKNCSNLPFNIIALTNPFNNELSLNLKTTTSARINMSIYDALGQELKKVYDNTILEGETTSISLNTNDLAQSIYFLSGNVNNEPFTLKLIKTNN